MDENQISTSHIEYLEKDFIDSLPESVELSSLETSKILNIKLSRIKGITNFWEVDKNKNISLKQIFESVLSGFCESIIPVVFGIFGSEDEIEIIFGSYANTNEYAQQNLNTFKTSLQASLQGIKTDKLPDEYLTEKLSIFNNSCILTGNSSDNPSLEKNSYEQIEKLTRGLFGQKWGFLVFADPISKQETNSLYNLVLNELRIISNIEKSSGMESPISHKYKELLRLFLTKLQFAKSQGLWYSISYLFTVDSEKLMFAKAIAKSAFGGNKSLPDRIRTIDVIPAIKEPVAITNKAPEAPGNFRYAFAFMSTLNSSALANLIHIPSQEMPGYAITPYARFGVSRESVKDKSIDIGDIYDQGKELGMTYNIPLESLTKHGLVAGTTGGGKTNTLFYLLKEAWKNKIPFFVLEPVKSEYKKLMLDPLFKEDLQIFTLGNNIVSPFRINPFEVPQNVMVQTHIDLLKSIFNGSFYMWNPLPQILEDCIQRVYLDKGWDLTANYNPRGVHINAFPTLTELNNKIEEIVPGLGYSQETTRELASSLKTRINSLRIGGKGMMLDTRCSFPFEKLMKKPTIFELEAMGDDEEKAFIMGLIIAFLYEYYISKGTSNKELKHITVVEEAHRLLANYTSQNQFAGNPKGKAVEAFTNVLAEIRSYGESILIAEQIPSKLAPEVMKNTSLKIMHRIVAEDDRKSMAASMNINEQETKRVTSFVKGESAVFSEGDTKAFNVQVHKSEVKDVEISNEELYDQIKKGKNEEISKYLAPYSLCNEFCESICNYKQQGDELSGHHRYFKQFRTLILMLLDNPEAAKTIIFQMFEVKPMQVKDKNSQKQIQLCAVISASERFFNWLGKCYAWKFEEVETCKKKFIGIILQMFDKIESLPDKEKYKEINVESVTEFKKIYTDLCRDKQPFDLCQEICKNKLCIYRYFLDNALSNDEYHDTWNDIINNSGDEVWEKLNELCSEAANGVCYSDLIEETALKIKLCFALQKGHSITRFSPVHINRIIENLSGFNV